MILPTNANTQKKTQKINVGMWYVFQDDSLNVFVGTGE